MTSREARNVIGLGEVLPSRVFVFIGGKGLALIGVARGSFCDVIGWFCLGCQVVIYVPEL